MRLVALALAASLASYGTLQGPNPPSTTPPLAAELVPLAGTRWEVTAVGGQGTGGRARYLITFEAGSLRANLGCNDLRGGFVVQASRLVPTGSDNTERGCFDPRPGAPDPMRFEEAGFRVLRRPMDMEVVGDLLSLSNRAGSLTLRRLP